MTEIWRDVEGLEGKYQVSNLGNVKSLRFKKQPYAGVLKPSKDVYGYEVVRIGGKMRKVHRLVAAAFIPRIEGKDFINHLDGNKRNNKADNLEWVTCAENTRHAYAMGLAKPQMTRRVLELSMEKTRHPVSQYDNEGNHVRDYISIREAAKAINRSYTSISMCASGRRKSCGGYAWKYKD